MKLINKNIFVVILLSALILPGCIKDTIAPPETFRLDNSALVLTYLESQGDYINAAAPSLINSAEVYQNKGDYLIIDLRSNEQFSAGHIEGAVNTGNDSLLEFLNGKSSDHQIKAVLVSQNGQSSSYYTCLLRLYGYANIYSLNFGMSSWNGDFANDWKDHLKTLPVTYIFNDISYPKADVTALPKISLSNTGKSLEDNIRSRISELISKGFVKDTNYIGVEDLFTGGIENFSPDEYYLACYGNGRLYNSPFFEGPQPGMGHPEFGVFYEENADLRSGSYLQTMPSGKAIAIYSYSGQLSAFAAAYLRLLGYNAKSVLFGANNIFYSRMEWDPYLNDKAFTPDKIMSYPYVTGP